MDRSRTYAVVLEPEEDGGFTVRVPALPEIVTFGVGGGPLDTTLTAQTAAPAEEEKPAAGADSVASTTAPPPGADTAAKDAPTAAAAGVH